MPLSEHKKHGFGTKMQQKRQRRAIDLNDCLSLATTRTSREEDDLRQYVKEPAVGNQGAVSTLQKLLRQIGCVLPAVSTLTSAFHMILTAFNQQNQSRTRFQWWM